MYPNSDTLGKAKTTGDAGLPIDRGFQRVSKKRAIHNGHSVWQTPAAVHGIHGTRVAVDLDLCTGCLKCLTLCPVNVFVRWTPQPGQARVDPAGENGCLECLACEIICPVDAILIARAIQPGDTLKALVD